MKTIQSIVKGNLCVRCGGCIAVCPKEDALKLDTVHYPVINKNVCNNCGMCLKVCPFNDINIPVLKTHFTGASLNGDLHDEISKIDFFVGYSNDDFIRKSGSSGGLVTQLLLHLLTSKQVDAVTVVTNHANPIKPVAKLTNSTEDVINSVGSKYTVVPVNERLKDIHKIRGKIAFVGLPCHIQSLRMWESLSARVKSKMALTISLFCNHNLEREAALYLLHRQNIHSQDIERLSFRHESWPGGIAVKLKNKEWQPLHGHTVKEAYNFLSNVFDCEPCRNCVDFCGDLADISVGDPWLRGDDGRYIFSDSRSLIMARTETGRQNLLAAQEAKAITLHQISESLFIKNFMPVVESKRRRALHRINKLKKRGRLYPSNHLAPESQNLLQRLKDDLKDISLTFYRQPLVRDAYLSFVFSRYGDMYSSLKNSVKRWNFARKSKIKIEQALGYK